MSKRLTVALVGSAAIVGFGVVAVRGTEGDAAVEPARAAVVSPQHGASKATGRREDGASAVVRWRSAPKLPALAPPRRARAQERDTGVAPAGRSAPAPLASAGSAPRAPTPQATPAAPVPAPVAPAPAAPVPAPKASPPPPVDFLSSG